MTGLVLALGSSLLLTACGGGAGDGVTPAPSRFTAALDSDASIGCAGASLELDTLSSDGLQFRLRARRLAGAKAIYGRVNYDPALYSFEECTAPGKDGVDRLWLAKDRPEAGYVEFGWVLPGFERRQGRRGELELCTIRFAPGAARVTRAASGAPEGQYNVFTLAGSVDGDNVPSLNWNEAHSGDGNNDGLVNINDLTQIGQQWENAAAGTGPTTKADYNNDGFVLISDLAQIGQNWLDTLGGYAVFSGTDEASLTELTRLDRSAQFATSPVPTDGVLAWGWTGDALTENTYYQVQPYDNTGALGLASDNVVLLEYTNPEPVITDIVTIIVPPEYPVDGNGNHIVLISEYSVDEIWDNNEGFAPEFIQLTAKVLIDIEPGDMETSEGLIWYISEGSGRAQINVPLDPGSPIGEENPGGPGVLTFVNRGLVTVTAQLPGDYTKTATASFVLLSIQSVSMVSGGSAGPIAASAGDVVPFTVTGTFDWDGISNLNEVEQNITNFCNWGALVEPPATSYSLNTHTGSLDTTGAAGAEIRVTCEYPRTENVTIGDNTRKASNLVTVNVS
jgi:hypothetical protein